MRSRRNPLQCLVDAVGDAGQGAIVDLAGGVELGMIIRITEKSRVRDHDGRIPEAPKRPVIGPIDAGEKSKWGRAFEREIADLHEMTGE